MNNQEILDEIGERINNQEKFSKMKDVLIKKGQDYSSLDMFWNFTTTGIYADIDPNIVFKVMEGIKISRLINLIKFTEGNPNFESIDDTVLDLANYMVLHLIYIRKNIEIEIEKAIWFGNFTIYTSYINLLLDGQLDEFLNIHDYLWEDYWEYDND